MTFTLDEQTQQRKAEPDVTKRATPKINIAARSLEIIPDIKIQLVETTQKKIKNIRKTEMPFSKMIVDVAERFR
jgi:hypothetical protein